MRKAKNIFKGKSTLVVILGIHGGGAATAKWLNLHGARVTVTDMRTKEELKNSLKKFSHKERNQISFILGGQREEDFRTHDLVVIGPGVPRESPFLLVARSAKKQIENDASIFFRYVDSPVLAVTGTRGKTTTTHFLAQLFHKKYPRLIPTGNNPANPFFQELDRSRKVSEPVVAEMSSWQLEYLIGSHRAPKIAAITNLFPDHLNRYGGMKDYARAKANIFLGQKRTDMRILRWTDTWTPFYLAMPYKGKTFFVSSGELPADKSGVFVSKGFAILRLRGKEIPLFSLAKFAQLYGAHNVENLLFATLMLFLYDSSIKISEKDILRLKTPPMRQEIIRKSMPLIINDSCATSPDGVIAAIKRFAVSKPIVLITGGTDKELQFGDLARTINKYRENISLVLLEGSATEKLIAELKKRRVHYDAPHKTLQQTMGAARRVAKEKNVQTVIFSPGAASFEKFLHEFDRGEKFNELVKRYWG